MSGRVQTYSRRPEDVLAVCFDGTAECLDAIRTVLKPTMTVGEPVELGGIIYDWDLFQWKPFRVGDWIVRDARGVCRPIGEDTFRLQFLRTFIS